MFLFGSRKSPQDILRENQRTLNRAIREMDRERLSLETQEKNYLIMAKKAAKSGQISSVKLLTRDTVRVRSQINRFFELRTQLQAVSLRLQTLQSTQSIASVMTSVTKAIKIANKKTDITGLSKIIQEFEKQNIIMGIKEETLGDTLDSIVSDQMEEGYEEDAEMAADELMRKILDEAGVTTGESFQSVPHTPIQLQVTELTPPSKVELSSNGNDDIGHLTTSTSNAKDADLEARLMRLKRG